MKKTETIPKSMRDKFKEISGLTDAFAANHLNDEYAQVIRQAIATLCRKRPSPLAKGKAATWACGITHAIGVVNFLFDKSQAIHTSASELYKTFGVAESTGQGKSKLVRKILKIYQFDPNWTLPSKLHDNPMVWLITVNGFTIDARMANRDIQEAAFEQGFIPYIPGEADIT
jgi:hypothetical protein